jgi:hypothetical protein
MLQAAAADRAPLPQRVRPATGGTGSHPFLAAEHQVEPLDLREHGYVEEEYLISGQARVYDWPALGGYIALAQGPYATRILVRRPASDARFSGAVIVEGFNPSTRVDLPIMWAQSFAQFVADGHAWVGVTVKPNTIKSLLRFDSARYGELSMAHPPSGSSCASAEINPWSQPTTPGDETGLAWDILSQVGALLKSGSADNPLSRPATRIYMTGQSQTAGYARTYATVFGRSVLGPDDRPLYDAYLYSGSPPWQVPLHQCAASIPDRDPRLITAAAGVPVVEVFAQGDIGTNIASRRPDSDTPPDLFRRYEVAGAAHTDPWEALSFPAAADMQRAAGQSSALGDPECNPRDVEPSDFPIRYALNAAWRNLDDWVRNGVAPPHGVRLQLKPDLAEPFDPERAFVTDSHGNALGGVRTPFVDVPTARWVGAKTGSFNCMFRGYKFSFDSAELEKLYGGHADYLARVRASVAALQTQRWLTATDAAQIVRDAERAPFP